MACTFSEDTIARTIDFHGHSCPGLSIGIRAAELALRELGDPAELDMVAVSETDMCGVDAIQFLTGCTYGKGNFLHRDYGKMAFSFFDRRTGRGFRAVLRPEVLRESVKEAASDPAEEKNARRELVMSLPLDDLFTVAPAVSGPPRSAQILQSLVCDGCGESVMESRVRHFAGKHLCVPCFLEVEQKI